MSNNPIVVIGSSCRFPGDVDCPSKLWDTLCQTPDLLKEIPKERFNTAAFHHKDGHKQGHTNVKKAYLLNEDLAAFDSTFFNINPREAEAIDPQHRILLEVVYEALQSAGIPLDQTKGTRTSVYVGMMSADWHDMHMRDIDSMPVYMATGSARSIAANRISYFFDWHGLSITIDTACSSSLVAMHLAVQSLQNGECDTAIVAGANLILRPDMFVSESKLNMLSPEGRSRMWDANANGYARGEGFAAIVLKPLNKALTEGYGDAIECIVRGSGVNQDGRTTGITMPSAKAQTQLIQDTYARAGLHWSSSRDRCQYFEAHGTGTPAGDPIEAEAIYNAFFSTDDNDSDRLYVGSIKTVIGHLEGCAGLAAILKASLSLQKGKITPNLHYCEPNPRISPFLDHLKVPTSVEPWPKVEEDQPRRASVNSFGFGGTNAHVILESYSPAKLERHAPIAVTPRDILPISSHTEAALLSNLKALSTYLKSEHSISVPDLCWTLQERRSRLPIREAFAVSSCAQLIASIDARISDIHTTNPQSTSVFAHTSSKDARLLGIFTGQGAQWPQMGLELIKSSPFYRDSLSRLDDVLKALPDGPDWTIEAELFREAENSQINSAQLAQPLCTATQIALIDLLKYCNVSFDVVVGHSSGEVACAYAAGILDAQQAMAISYYRGLHSRLSGGHNGESGGMLAVSMSANAAAAFCEEELGGRLVVAASNAPESSTLSGDADAITEAEKVLKSRGLFARRLKTDKAYHSPHMAPCAGPYYSSIQAFHQNSHVGVPTCTWVSSVYGRIMDIRDADWESLKNGRYWLANLQQPVLFQQAISVAMREYDGELSLAIEIGPHPALKGPVTQTIKAEKDGNVIPYHGAIVRAEDATITFTDALCAIWNHVGGSSVDFSRYRHAFGSTYEGTFVKDLPPYQWVTDTRYWAESRLSVALRQRPRSRHELLGSPSDFNIQGQVMTWRNILRLGELPYLRGHVVQNEVVFPAAGFLCLALEASTWLEGYEKLGRNAIELRDVHLLRALVLQDGNEDSGPEIMFTLKSTDQRKADRYADFACFSLATDGSWTKHAFGSLMVHEVEDKNLPTSSSFEVQQQMQKVDIERFFEELEAVGLQYTGMFKSIRSAHRALNVSRCSIVSQSTEGEYSTIHPAILDSIFQCIFAAASAPGDGMISSPYLPTTISRLQVFAPCPTNWELDAHAWVTKLTSAELSAELELVNPVNDRILLQIDGFDCTALGLPARKEVFSSNVWEYDIASAWERAVDIDSAARAELCELCERLSLHYFRRVESQIPPAERSGLPHHFQLLFEFVEHLLQQVQSNKHPTLRSEWMNDEQANFLPGLKRFGNEVDVQLIQAVGTNMTDIIRGHKAALEIMMADNLLDRLYKEGLGFPDGMKHLSQCAERLAHRYPSMNIIEVGAGTGGATKFILEHLKANYRSYTFTDISAGFFESAKEQFDEHAHKMDFRTLDIESDLEQQGFKEHSYDVVVAANVLHATRSLEVTMTNVRKLLKPGGYLLLLEVTSEALRVRLMMSCLPGWWLGADDGRRFAPTVTHDRWDAVLRKTGFSGTDKVIHDFTDDRTHVSSAIVSQAVDERVAHLRQPLESGQTKLQPNDVLVVGSEGLSQDLVNYLWQFPSTSLEDVSHEALHGRQVVCIDDREGQMLVSMTALSLEGLKRIFATSQTVLWITKGCRKDNPFANMAVGLGRSLRSEYPQLQLQFVDLDAETPHDIAMELVAGALVRLCSTSEFDPADNMLVTTEPELSIERGQLLIPRLKPDTVLNDRANAARMPVRQWASACGTECELAMNQSAHVLKKRSMSWKTDGYVSIAVTHSLLYAVRLSASTSLFLCIGRIEETGSWKGFFQQGDLVIALSQENAPHVCVPAQWVRRCPTPNGCEPEVLRATAASMVAGLAMADLTPGESILCYGEADPVLASMVDRKAAAAGILVLSMTASDVNCFTTKRHLRSVLAHDIGLMMDMSSEGVPDPLLMSLESSPYRRWNKADAYATKAKTTYGTDPMIQLRLQEAIQDAAQSDLGLAGGSRLISLAELEHSHAVDPSSIVAWDFSGPVSVRVEPVEPATLFRPDRTYLLVGCTGGLGQSLCIWMARNGARYFALGSRDPSKVGSRLLTALREMGATVKLLTLDVTQRADVRRAVNGVKATMPPVAGVANAAMVLRDTMFADMKMEDWEPVLGPKVYGSLYLDELFQEASLDFFVMFSSLASVLGNGGQSNYNAANAFMATLAHKRRERGLAGSTLDIGMVLGVGYVAETGVYESTLRRFNYMALSETDFHNMFAEAIVAGRPGSKHDAEIITGLHRISRGQEQNVRIADNPWFSHYVVDESESSVDDRAGSAATTLRELLADGDMRSDAMLATVQEAFAMKLGRILQAQVDVASLATPLIELGIDSLMAVQVRFWFLNELGVDIPVLAVLGSAPAAELCVQAIAKRQSTPPPDGSERPSNSSSASAPVTSSGREVSGRASETPSEAPSETASSIHSEVLSKTASTSPSETPSEEATRATSKDGLNGIFTDRGASKPCTPVATSPMSFAQERLWFLDRFLEDTSALNVTMLFRLAGELRPDRLAQALEAVAQRNESLRSCYSTDVATSAGQVQVLSEAPFSLGTVRCQDEAGALAVYEQAKREPFDLAAGGFRALLVRAPGSDFLLLSFHHIALDGYSARFLAQDLQDAYRGQHLAARPAQYRHFAADERRRAAAGAFTSGLAFWAEELRGLNLDAAPLLPLAKQRARPLLRRYSVGSCRSVVPASAAQRLRRFRSATAFHVFLAALQTLVATLLDQHDFCIGIPTANRTNEDHLDTVGFFVNPVPVRAALDPSNSLETLVQRARRAATAALSHAHVPFDLMLDHLGVRRSPTHHPLFQVVLNFKPGVRPQLALGTCRAELVAMDDAKMPYDVWLDVEQRNDGGFDLAMHAQSTLYTARQLHLLSDSFHRVLDAFAHAPVNSAFTALSLLRDKEHAAVLQVSRGARVSPQHGYPTVLHWIDAVAAKNPERDAIKMSAGPRVTYAGMQHRIACISAALQEQGIASGKPVAVLGEPSIDSLCALLAVMRIGAVYVPLDPQNPPARLSLVLRESGALLLLYHRPTEDTARSIAHNVCEVMNIEVSDTQETPTIPIKATPASTAYILFTSGSTGIPKGVCISHSALVNYFGVMVQRWGFRHEVTLQQTSPAFDMSMDQIFTALCSGGTVILPSRQLRRNPFDLAELMCREGVTYTFFAPTEFSALLRAGYEPLKKCSRWHMTSLGGEAATHHLAAETERLGLPSLRLFDRYGPTETTITATAGPFSVASCNAAAGQIDGATNIGRVIENYSVYVLDKQLNLVPFGMPGEIYIGGAGVALGYLNRPDLNSERFIEDPFASDDDRARGWSRMYRTGDRGIVNQDGTIFFLGRIKGDLQVKIRGFRIELDDIESAILSNAQDFISDVAVVVAGQADAHQDQKFLAAFVKAKAGISEDQAHAQLKQLPASLPLPHYMCPSMFHLLPEMPITTNGKVDRSALATTALTQRQDTNHDSIKVNLNDAESQLALIWQTVLPFSIPLTAIHADSDFFELGGNSSLVVRLQEVLRSRLDCRVSLADLFSASRLGPMAALALPEATGPRSLTELLDWDAETSMPEVTRHVEISGDAYQADQKKAVVVLTGATGFLGRAILRRLLQESNSIAEIHLVAVRNCENESTITSSLQLGSSPAKVIVHQGDLQDQRLGLSEASWADLEERATIIIHNGADVSFLKSYHSLRKSNVQSTAGIVRLAMPRRIPIHYVSSISVAELGPLSELPPTSVAQTVQPPRDGSHGYAASKWASEVLLERVNEKIGIPVCVHRPTSIVGDGVRSTDLMHNVLEFSRATHTVPDLQSWSGFLDFVDVHVVARDLVGAALTPPQGQQREVRYEHHCGQVVVPITGLKEHMENESGENFGQCSLEDWVVKAIQARMDSTVAAMILRVLGANGGIMPKVLKR